MSHRYDTAVAIKLPYRLVDPLRSDRHRWRKGEDTVIVLCADDFKSTNVDGQLGWSLSLIEDEHSHLDVDRRKQVEPRTTPRHALDVSSLMRNRILDIRSQDDR